MPSDPFSDSWLLYGLSSKQQHQKFNAPSLREPHVYTIHGLGTPEAVVSPESLSGPYSIFSGALMLRIHLKAEEPAKCSLTTTLL